MIYPSDVSRSFNKVIKLIIDGPDLWSDRDGAIAPRHPVYNVRTLQRKLQQEGMIKTMSIKANTPIVKFSTRYGATEFDICANDLGGW